MPLPVTFAADWKRFNRSLLRGLYYRAYDPEADEHAAEPGEECVGVKGAVTTGWDGGRAVPACEFTLTGTEAAPVTRSLLVDDSDEWVITTVESDPAGGTVHRCQCVKG